MKFCLIGFPLGHSMSPFIHQRLFEIQHVKASYDLMEISPEAFSSDALPDKLQTYNGFNVTIPHKVSVIPLLRQLMGNAAQLHTVNTVRNDHGVLYGYNTDCDGFLKALQLGDIALAGRVLICGSGGGTARMMAHIAAQHNCTITLSSRRQNDQRTMALAAEIRDTYSVPCQAVCRDDLTGTFDLLCNASPAGMYPNNIGLFPVSKDIICASAQVFDAVYNPADTALLQLARSNGAKAIGGMPMLVYQAAKAQQLWYGAQFTDHDLLNLTKQANDQLKRSFHG